MKYKHNPTHAYAFLPGSVVRHGVQELHTLPGVEDN